MALLAALAGAIAPALGAAAGEDPRAGLSGTFVVCKEYGTVLGTFLADLRGRNLARLNFLCGEDVSPRFSPDGERILFTSTRGGTPGLWITNRKGEDAKRICDGDQGDWFPDGQRVAFRRQGQILERSLDSGKETVLSPAGWKSCLWPACSPDGKQILFLVAGAEKDSIFSMAPGAAEPKRLAEGETLGAPRWSPAGDRIAYQREAHIWMMDADGRNPRQLTTSGGIQRRPAWSPDGTAIAYCQGPSPRGPWQLAVTRADGTRTFLVPPEGARSVLCPDWGVAEPGKRPAIQPGKATAAPPPRVSLWEIEAGQPRPATREGWAAFCHEKRGWAASPRRAGGVSPDNKVLRGGCAVETGQGYFIVLPGCAGAIWASKANPPRVTPLELLSDRGDPVGPLERVGLSRYDPDEVVLTSGSEHAGRAIWCISGSRLLIQLGPAGKLGVSVPLKSVVATDRLGDDLWVEPGSSGGRLVALPQTPIVMGLAGDGTDLLVMVPSQRVGLLGDRAGSFLQAQVVCRGQGIGLGFLAGERLWHVERFEADRQADPVRFKWDMPFPAAWRLTVEGGGKVYSTLFNDKESASYDKKHVLFRKGKEFEGPARSGVICLYDRTASTPLDVLTPMDIARDALGLKGAERALDEEGVTGYRVAAKPTTWADLSVTIQSLRFLFEQHVEVQDNVYAGHLIDDILPFVEGMDQRLAEYGSLAREIPSDKANPVAALDSLAPISKKLDELAEKQRGLKDPKVLLPIVAKIRQLTAQDSSENRKQFEACCKDLLAAVGPREEMIKAYRKLVIELRDAAGNALLAHTELLEAVEQIRASCHVILRNRLYIEGDWRGEDYKVPAFWLGPRPYE